MDKLVLTGVEKNDRVGRCGFGDFMRRQILIKFCDRVYILPLPVCQFLGNYTIE